MVNFRSNLKQMARPAFWKRSYAQADHEPSFNLKCLDIEGYGVTDTSSEDASRVLADILHKGEIAVNDVCLLFSPVEGVKVLGRSGEELTTFKIQDIAYGGVDATHPEYFLMVCNHEDELRCHVFLCQDLSQGRLLLANLNKTFNRLRCMLQNNNDCPESTQSTKDVKKGHELRKSNPSSPKISGQRSTSTPCNQIAIEKSQPAPSSKNDSSTWRLNLPKKLLPHKKSLGYESVHGQADEDEPLL